MHSDHRPADKSERTLPISKPLQRTTSASLGPSLPSACRQRQQRSISAQRCQRDWRVGDGLLLAPTRLWQSGAGERHGCLALCWCQLAHYTVSSNAHEVACCSPAWPEPGPPRHERRLRTFHKPGPRRSAVSHLHLQFLTALIRWGTRGVKSRPFSTFTSFPTVCSTWNPGSPTIAYIRAPVQMVAAILRAF